MRVAAGRAATLRLHLVDESGQPASATGTPTVTVTDGSGTALYTAQPGTLAGGVWTWPLPPQSNLDSLAAVWTAVVGGVTVTDRQQVDVVAQRLVEPWILRQDPSLAALSAEQLLLLLDEVEEAIREIAGFPPVLEGARVSFDSARGALNDAMFVSGTLTGLPYGAGGGRMLIPGVKYPVKVYSGSINGVVLDPVNDVPKLSVQNGALMWSDYRAWISGRYSFWLTHGDPNPPRDVRRVAARLVKHASRTSDYPDRAASVQTEGALITFAGTGPNRPTGIPEVDAVLVRYRAASVI